MSIKYRTSAGTSASNFTDLVVKVGDTLPIGTEVDYDGQSVPAGWQEVDDPNVYSTTEKRVGTWIDGKPLYRKCYSTTTPSTSSDTSLEDVTSLNIANITKLDTYIQAGEYIYGNYYYANNNYGCVYYNSYNKQIRTVQTKYNDKTIYIIVEYTKTTD